MQDCVIEKSFDINNIVYKEGDESNYIYLVKEEEFILQKSIDYEREEAENLEMQALISSI